ncbi:DUF262 domain-containing protein [Rufibacter roseolus]|uniref:DUF262 domain-containing protein n=1 Tax=Rufibacter roseolus TaxID=2817375 RepID=UPI001B3069A8|nr:DUF262 domain-containing HNH endonuclease family protein [Rufibacter roseolus]
MINIEQAFNTENRSVFEYYQRPGVGFYIPLYQREYSWDNSNIEQLLEDISKGIENIIEDDETEIRFLGTIITVTETDKNKVQPQDTRALPSSIEKVIDGQQRLSTISLLSALLVKHINDTEAKVLKALTKYETTPEAKEELQEEISEICKYWREKTYDVFSVDLKRGKPTRKPKIIRGSVDKWVMQEPTNSSYVSSVSGYLYAFISYAFDKGEAPKFDKDSNAGKNLAAADAWLRKTVLNAHLNYNGFCPASKILEKINQEYLWQYDRQNLYDIIEEADFENPSSLSSQLSSLVQLLAVCHYLLDRCCFTIIQPVDDDWAFDMFQSLNATGTPLTAIETFKPLVVNTLNIENIEFKGSVEDKYFCKVEHAFGDLRSAAQKSKMTNELLTSFALPVESYKLATHFSSQRKWLEKIYDKKLKDFDDKQAFIKFFGNYSEFYKMVWQDYTAENNQPISYISSSNEADLVSLLVLYLRQSNHKMSITILGSLFHSLSEGTPQSVTNFTQGVKLIAAFYTLWRAAKSNAGLDDAYRSYFRGNAKEDIEEHTWLKDKSFSLDSIREHFQNILRKGDIATKDEWVQKASSYLRYDRAMSVCRFALFVSAHDTINDPYERGLVKLGTPNSNPILNLQRWNSEDLKSIEHIAPRKGVDTWSGSLYDDSALFDSLGNLTLLPLPVNSSAGNKGWKEKLIYYKHLNEKDPNKVIELRNFAKNQGFNLDVQKIASLQDCNYSHHIDHIIQIDEEVEWDAELVKRRTARMLEIVWDRINGWIFN